MQPCNSVSDTGHCLTIPASHFIEDVGNPMHTGYETQQYSNPWVHSNYETYVGNRWYSSNFDYVVSNNNLYYYNTNWNQQTKNLALYARTG
jgi:hypothetical protein